VFIVLGAAVWWWISWPERTARDFVDLFATGHFDDAAELLSPKPQGSFFVIVDVRAGQERPLWMNSSLHAKPRTFLDVVHARQDFEMRGMGSEFRAEKNKILKQQSFAYLAMYERRESGFGERGNHEIWRIIVRSKILPQVP
jgi:hypothetical protein